MANESRPLPMSSLVAPLGHGKCLIVTDRHSVRADDVRCLTSCSAEMDWHMVNGDADDPQYQTASSLLRLVLEIVPAGNQ